MVFKQAISAIALNLLVAAKATDVVTANQT